jgi:hypothetical protein
VRRLLALVLLASSVLAACGSDDGGGESGTVAEAVEQQLAYLQPESELVVAVDLRWEGENLESLRAITDRLLEETRGVVDAEQKGEVPADAEAALTESLRSLNVRFEDIRPALSGHLVMGLAFRPGDGDPREQLTIVYRSEEGDMRKALEAFLPTATLRPMRGRDDVLVAEGGFVLVDGDTMVAADTTEEAIAAVERADSGRGFPAELLEAAESDIGVRDPLVLGTGTLDLAREFVDDEDLERARTQGRMTPSDAEALASIGIDLDQVRRQIEEAFGPGALDRTRPPAGRRGRWSSGHLPFEKETKKVLELSLREALALGHNYIGCEHILLAMLHAETGTAGQILRARGVRQDAARIIVEELVRGRRAG